MIACANEPARSLQRLCRFALRGHRQEEPKIDATEEAVVSKSKTLNLNSAVGTRKYSVKLLMLIQKLCLEISTMANPFGEAL